MNLQLTKNFLYGNNYLNKLIFILGLLLFNSVVKLLMIRCQFSLTIFTHFISILPIEFTMMHFSPLHCRLF